ncbi:MAG: glycosyltransferase [Candidatus Scalindua sp. AMX11]|nr:MAG: glycosyltransferase [Candidatus Scalindua sp.]NOG83953.1 glycosyltransferase [Planctomycetota bacterium]RZV88025.1 MAG: glycosyltransferase [Candidatus Scalindua sp. SCAELEC01]TDE63148.1 MAG: glycosyltransferase [Candidatus Scalindua sp. AMX11]GJQ58397.1 MAG: glycosyl transferase [Candidatus Scalindua sp.]
MDEVIEGVDIIAGIPSLNEADNIAFVTQQLALGLREHFSHLSALIINVDNNSKDGTREAFMSADTGDIPKRYISTDAATVGKGNNMWNLLHEVVKERAKAVMVVDADLKSITPEWVKIFVTPILEGNDYIAPLYSRNEYDGTITNHITYPLIYSLFKANIRQPIGGDFSFSPRMATKWLDMEWEESTRQYGIDIFMTTSALLNGFKVGQVVLGSKVHKPSAPKLGPMFTQVVSTLFSNISRFQDTWINGKARKECQIFGQLSYKEPQGLPIDYKELKRKGIDGFFKEERLLSSILPLPHYNIVKKMHATGRWNISSRLWTKILYDFIHAYEISENREAIIEALKPVYFARAASFYRQTLEMTHQESEEKIVNQAKLFHKGKRYLVDRFQR